jgi:hypothetical protein
LSGDNTLQEANLMTNQNYKFRYDKCYAFWKNNPGNLKGWDALASDLGFVSGQAAQSWFKRERKRYGDEKEKPKQAPIKSGARIVVMDIETLYAEIASFGIHEQHINHNQILREGCILSWVGKELNSANSSGLIMDPEEAIRRDDFTVVKGAHEFLKDAEIVIGHNWRNFDEKMLNTAFLLYGLPVLKHRIIDTYEIVKQAFRFQSNSLEYVNKRLGIRQKQSAGGLNTWKGCSDGNMEDLLKMFGYNQGDVYATEELYHKIKPWAEQHPNLALYDTIEDMRCPICLSDNLKIEGHYPATQTTKYVSVRCECGALHRMNDNLITKTKIATLLRQ